MRVLPTTRDLTLASSRSIFSPFAKDGELDLVTPADPETLYIPIIKSLTQSYERWEGMGALLEVVLHCMLLLKAVLESLSLARDLCFNEIDSESVILTRSFRSRPTLSAT